MKFRYVRCTIAYVIRRGLFMLLKTILVLLSRELLIGRHAAVQMAVRVNTLARQESQHRLNDFVSIISHDLKTPLTSIKGNIQLMGRKLGHALETCTPTPTEARLLLIDMQNLVGRTDQQILHLTHLINSLLESSRIYANEIELCIEMCELKQVILEAIEEIKNLSPERVIHFTIAAQRPLLVMVDPGRIKQVVVHYLTNAHVYSELHHPIEVALQEEGQTVLVLVRDKGHGIAHGEQERIWERFYRVPGIKTLNSSEVGLGLGLHICRTLIEQHHGQVGVKSAPEQGSTFWFTLPLLKKQSNE